MHVGSRSLTVETGCPSLARFTGSAINSALRGPTKISNFFRALPGLYAMRGRAKGPTRVAGRARRYAEPSAGAFAPLVLVQRHRRRGGSTRLHRPVRGRFG